MNRKSKIIALRKDHTFEEMGREFGISRQRVEQIESRAKMTVCKEHNFRYKEVCRWCHLAITYAAHLESILNQPSMMDYEARLLSKRLRNREMGIKRRIFTLMAIKKGWSTKELVAKLRRHRSIIKYYYAKP